MRRTKGGVSVRVVWMLARVVGRKATGTLAITEAIGIVAAGAETIAGGVAGAIAAQQPSPAARRAGAAAQHRWASFATAPGRHGHTARTTPSSVAAATALAMTRPKRLFLSGATTSRNGCKSRALAMSVGIVGFVGFHRENAAWSAHQGLRSRKVFGVAQTAVQASATAAAA